MHAIPIDKGLLQKLSRENRLISSNSAVALEFGITNLLPFIKKYLPEALIIPLLIPADMHQETVTELVNRIHEVSPSGTMMIASVDFSHYLPPQAAAFHDIKSIRILLNMEEEHFENIEVDSWQSLYAVRLFARLRGKENPIVIGHQNSVHFLPYDFDCTTSYFSVIFRQENTAGDDNDAETILLTGDIMLDRGIEKSIRENSIYYPFQNIVQLLRGIDTVFANLEGPIVESPLEFSGNLPKFAFHPDVLEGISWSQINLLSLANNHTTDMGKEGLEETVNWLEKYRIHFSGIPFSLEQNRMNNAFTTRHAVWLSFNRILPFIHYQEEIIKAVTEAKSNHPEKFLIVSMHWGNEYQLTSSLTQRQLARQMIAAGADLIVGHHPHVVQEIEMVEGKLVFYSLGNFIFDQQSLPDTREGLTVGLTIYPERITCRLFPIRCDCGQPGLMNQNAASDFLKKLAQRSDKKLWNDIEKGIIEIHRSP